MSEASERSAVAASAVMAALTSSALGAAFAKSLFPEIGPEGVTTLRVAFSALILLAIARPWRKTITRDMAVNLIVYGTVLGAMNMLIYQAFARIPLGIAIAIEVTGPITIALMASRKVMDFVWVGCAVLGLSLLLPLNPGSHLDPMGIAFAFGAAACWAIYIIAGKRVSTLGAGTAVSLGMLVATVVTAPVGLVHAGYTLFSPHIIGLGLVVAVLSSAVPYLLEMMAIKQLPRRVFGTLLSSAPAIGALVGIFVLGEDLKPAQWLAISLVILASAGSAIYGARPPRPPVQT